MKTATCENNRAIKTIEGSEGVIWATQIQTNEGYYKRPVVMLAPVLPRRNVFAIENRARDVEAKLHAQQLIWKSNQSKKLE